ncbi:MAG: ATP-binding protein [Gemmatimonadetes bacterium]|nr:ATP-binding protein [Gemmatimonadota bacterium]
MPSSRPVRFRLGAATVLLAVGLLTVGWFDYQATRKELLTLLIDQAASLRQAVAAAAQSADLATGQVQATLAARLLDNARFLAQMEKRGGLTQKYLDDVVREHRLLRVTLFSASGTRELTSGLGGPPPWAGQGLGPGALAGGGGGGGGGGAGSGPTIVKRLLASSETETVSEVHGSRWGTGWRLSAGIRRAAGGAIVLNADAEDIADLQRQASLDRLLGDIASRAGEIAYVILADDSSRSAHGRLADAALARDGAEPMSGATLPLPRDLANLTARERTIDGHPVLEFSGPLEQARPDGAVLRMGLALDGLRAAERRSLTRLVISLLAVLGLSGLIFAFAGLRQEHGVLREQHARAQDALRRRDRLAAMGELASTVAHEVRNPLNAIGMSVQRLRREFLDAAPDQNADAHAEQAELLDVLLSETARINRIVQQFLEFARPPRLDPRPVDLAAFLTEAAAGVAAMAAERGITLHTTIDDMGPANLDPDQFKQALDNLLRNALEASPDGASVALGARRTADGHEVVVEDHGAGIPPDHLPRIFDLYFTTKANGTGVGLAVTHQVIEAHGGTLEVDTELGRGTRMIIHLPTAGRS